MKSHAWKRAGFFAGLFLLLTAAGAKADWKQEWDRTVAAAKQEGRLMILSSQDYDLLFAEFQKKYPEIKVVATSGRVSQQLSRVMSERRAGKYLWDLFVDGASTGYAVAYKGRILAPLQPELLLPEVLDESKWWMKGKYNWVDDERKHIFSFNWALQPYFAYNTRLVNPREISSYWDLLDPKWKGRMVAMDPAIGGPVATPLRFLYYHPQLGPTFLKRLLSEMEVTFSRDIRQTSDWLIGGKYAISLFTIPQRGGLVDAQRQGLPVNWFGPKAFKEGIPLSNASGNLALFNRSPHPNAARLAINWLLSREGQIAYQKIFVPRSVSANSARLDVPGDMILPEFQRIEGGNYIATEVPEWMDMAPIEALVKEARAVR
jgi:iron(III) transport system substrate-binding protein